MCMTDIIFRYKARLMSYGDGICLAMVAPRFNEDDAQRAPLPMPWKCCWSVPEVNRRNLAAGYPESTSVSAYTRESDCGQSGLI